jgi:hypothetical protein
VMRVFRIVVEIVEIHFTSTTGRSAIAKTR